MMLFNYKSKKEMQENIGNHLNYTETSMFGKEYKSNGYLVGCNRPHINKQYKREFFAEVIMKDDKIVSVK